MEGELTPEEREARIRFYHHRLYPHLRWWLVPTASVAIYVLSLAFVAWARFGTENKYAKTFSVLLIAGWTLGPPTILFLEYFTMRRTPVERLPSIETFKYTREMARNFWIAAVAVLVATATGHLPGAGE
jgi:hypothetical protein